MGSYIPFKKPRDPKVLLDKIVADAPYFYCISYNTLYKDVLPIITDKKELKDLTIYDDAQIPKNVKEKLKELEHKMHLEVNILSFIGIWLSSKIPASIMAEGKLFTGINLYDKRVLAIAIPSTIIGFSFVREFVKMINLYDIQDIFFDDRKNLALSLYRKRLVETFPTFTGIG